MTDLAALSDAIQRGDRRRAVSVTREAIEQAATPQRILDAMTTAMDRVGGQFKRNEYFMPEILVHSGLSQRPTACPAHIVEAELRVLRRTIFHLDRPSSQDRVPYRRV